MTLRAFCAWRRKNRAAVGLFHILCVSAHRG